MYMESFNKWVTSNLVKQTALIWEVMIANICARSDQTLEEKQRFSDILTLWYLDLCHEIRQTRHLKNNGV